MDLADALARLAAAGTAQNRKVYSRHGVGEPLYGVSYAEQGKLAKRIGTDHDLALALWASGNHDARILATKVADPERIDRETLDTWVGDLDNYVATDALAQLAARTPEARQLAEAWMPARGEWRAAAGWNVTTLLASDGAVLGEDELRRLLATVEAEIHQSPNRVRHAMNGALIAVGGSHPALEAEALAAAGRIGAVEVDHGATGCKTPDAAAYIRKMAERRQARKGRG